MEALSELSSDQVCPQAEDVFLRSKRARQWAEHIEAVGGQGGGSPPLPGGGGGGGGFPPCWQPLPGWWGGRRAAEKKMETSVLCAVVWLDSGARS